MNEKPPLNPRNFRPAFIQEKQNAEIALDEGMRTCVGFPTLGFDEQGKKKISETICGKELPRGYRFYCSGIAQGIAWKMRRVRESIEASS